MSEHTTNRPAATFGTRLLWISAIILCAVMLVLVARTVGGAPLPRSETVPAAPPAPAAPIAPVVRTDQTAPFEVDAQEDAEVAKPFGDTEAMDTIAHATEVTLFRLFGERHSADGNGAKAAFDPDDVVGKAIPIVEPDAEHVRFWFSDPASVPRNPKACIPEFGVKIRFSTPMKSVDVLLCLRCKEVALFRSGKWIGTSDFDPIAPQVLDLVKRLLPDDDRLQSLR